MWRREDGERERERYVEEYRPERKRGEQLRGDGGPVDLKKTKGQGHEHLCYNGMPVWSGNLGSDRTTTTKAASVSKQLGTKHSKSNEGRQEMNGGVKEKTGVQKSLTERLVMSRLQSAGQVERMAEYRLPKRATCYVSRTGEAREANAEMGGLCLGRCDEDRRRGRLEKEDNRQRRVENTIR